MKNLFIIALAFVTLQATAQQKKNADRREMRNERIEMTPTERAELQTKKLTLHLDLKEKQQVKVNALLLEEAKYRNTKMEERKARMEERSEISDEKREERKAERLKMANEKLDRQIALKAKMKEILDAEQYTKWDEAMSKRENKGRRNGMKRKHDRKKGHKRN